MYLARCPARDQRPDQASGIAQQGCLKLFKDRLQPIGLVADFSVVHGFLPENRDLLQEQRSNGGFLRMFLHVLSMTMSGRFRRRHYY